MSLEALLTFVPLSGAASVGFFLAMAWVVHVISDHAAKHQGEEIETRDCLEQNGEWQVWREREEGITAFVRPRRVKSLIKSSPGLAKGGRK